MTTAMVGEKGKPKRTFGLVGCSVIFFLFVFIPVGFMVSGGFFFYSFYYRHLVGTFAARNWVRAPCVVVSSEANPKDPMFIPKITFRYEFKGRKYQSDRFHVAPVGLSYNHVQKSFLEKYPPGRGTVCYINPEYPRQAALSNRFVPGTYFSLIPLGVFAVGLTRLLLFALKSFRPRSAGNSSDRLEPPSLPEAKKEVSNVPIEFHYSPTAEWKRGVIWIILTWIYVNCFILSIAFPFVNIWFAGHFWWGWVVFRLFFVLINVIFLVWLGSLFIVVCDALFHPVVTISIFPVPLRPGEIATVYWQVRSRIRYLSRLTITLRGKKQTGETFTQITILDTENPLQMQGGHSQIDFPMELSSFVNIPKSKFHWEIHLAGTFKVKYCFGLDKTFPIEVAEISGENNNQLSS
jgi:hypothetical protein